MAGILGLGAHPFGLDVGRVKRRLIDEPECQAQIAELRGSCKGLRRGGLSVNG